MIRFLGQCLANPADLERLKRAIDKIEKCSHAVAQGMNLADLIGDPANQNALKKVFGEHFSEGIQLLVRTALHDFTSLSFTVHMGIEGERKLGFLHKSAAAWKTFEMVLQVQHQADESGPGILLLNP